jgi:hypothetical protein
MNLNAARPRTAVTRCLATRLSLWLLPAVLAPAASPGFAPPFAGSGSRPYLAVLGTMPLRVAEAAPPPDLSSRPSQAAPPRPDQETASDPAPIDEVKAEPSSLTPPAADLTPATPTRESAPQPARTPPPILVDDSRPRVRPEDFLPFFIFPGHGESNVIVPVTAPAPPAPGTLPPSSATYRQQ